MATVDVGMTDRGEVGPRGADAATAGVGEVTVEPAGATFELRPGEAVIQAAWRAGLYWPTTCWGQADCGACAMDVMEGAELLGPVGPAEATRLRALGRRGVAGRRLACQARGASPGALRVKKPGVRPR